MIWTALLCHLVMHTRSLYEGNQIKSFRILNQYNAQSLYAGNQIVWWKTVVHFSLVKDVKRWITNQIMVTLECAQPCLPMFVPEVHQPGS